jgi:hypothetical protein
MSQIPPPPPSGPGFQPQPQSPYPGYGAPQVATGSQTNGLAIGSFVCGLVGCLVITPIVGIILGVLGLKDAGKKAGSGRGLAVAGILLSLLWIGAFALGGVGLAKFLGATKPAKDVADAFVKDAAAGNIDAALAHCTSSVTREDVTTASKQLQPLGSVRNTMLFGAAVETTPGSKFWILGGAVTFGQNQGVPYQVKIVDQGGGVLKLDGYMLTVNNVQVTGGNPINGGKKLGK